MKISFSAAKPGTKTSFVIGLTEGEKLSGMAAKLDAENDGLISRAIAQSPRFSGKKGESLEVAGLLKLRQGRALVVGLGAAKSFSALDAEAFGGDAVGRLNRIAAASGSLLLSARPKGLTVGETAARIGLGAKLGAYRFDKYRTKEKPERIPTLKSLSVVTGEAAAAKREFASLSEVAEGVFLTRNLVSEPANVIYPESFANEVKELSKLGVKVKILNVTAMKKLGMGALLGVGQGSARDSRLVALHWQGSKSGENAKPLAIVGKGVTFDTGGISIKPAAGMEDMKWDMGGAGVVAGLMRALAGRKAKANVVGICGLVENMPSHMAQRPGDVVTSMSGQTIEVINTDAEGRLVLADALWYVQEQFKPRGIVDLATLTGAIIISLGHEHAGLFSNNDKLSEHLLEAGKEVEEKLWRLPLGEAYDRAIDSEIADMKNVGNRAGGSITAAQFLQRYIQKDTPWAHLDIAGVAWSSKDKPTVPKGGTGFGVRLLDRMIAAHYES
jgi:leucyl aminopeptidase